MSSLQRLFAGVSTAYGAYDLAAEALRVVVGGLRELVPVSGYKPLQGMTDEQELEVSLQPLLYLYTSLDTYS